MSSHSPGMYVVTEADAAAIREVYERDGELSAAIELRRRFPGIQDNAKAREQARAIACWTATTTPPSAHPEGTEGQGAVDAVCRHPHVVGRRGKDRHAGHRVRAVRPGRAVSRCRVDRETRATTRSRRCCARWRQTAQSTRPSPPSTITAACTAPSCRGSSWRSNRLRCLPIRDRRPFRE